MLQQGSQRIDIFLKHHSASTALVLQLIQIKSDLVNFLVLILLTSTIVDNF